MRLKRIVYFGYYIKKLNKPLFKKFLNLAKQETGKSNLHFYIDIFRNSLKYNISILEYFQFGFYKPNCTDEEKASWAGTGYMYEYQGFMNPRQYRDLLEDKTVFDKVYGKFIKHHAASLEDLKSDSKLGEQILSNPSGKIVFKLKDGDCGRGVEVVQSKDYDVKKMIAHMEQTGAGLVEDFVQQHEDINKLAPTALNTVRVFTQLRPNDEVVILGCRLRISVHGVTDNLAGGNIAAFIDPETGIVVDNGVYSDITKPEEEFHPVTGWKIKGTQIPFWKETIALAKEMATMDTRNRSIGWDIAITSTGPDVIEGNREWCKLLYQLPAKKGLKSVLDGYWNEYKS